METALTARTCQTANLSPETIRSVRAQFENRDQNIGAIILYVAPNDDPWDRLADLLKDPVYRMKPKTG